MTRKLGQFLNRTTLASIPAFFEDTKCRSYKLAGIELFPLWLEGGDFPTRLPPEDKRYSASAASVEGEVGRIVRLLVTTRWKIRRNIHFRLKTADKKRHPTRDGAQTGKNTEGRA